MIKKALFVVAQILKLVLKTALFLLHAVLKVAVFLVRHPRLRRGVQRLYRTYRRHHARSLGRAHHRLSERLGWYERWHRRRYHQHAHVASLGLYVAGVLTLLGLSTSQLLAATATWDFSTASEYTHDTSKIEFVGGVVQLKGVATPGVNWIAADGGGNNWAYRQNVTVNNTTNTSALTDYQVSLTTNTATLVAAGKLQADCDDLRFTDDGGVTPLSYWIESGCNTATTKIWVKVPSIPASSSATIRMYYGRPDALAGSSVATTFIREVTGLNGAWTLDETSGLYANDTSGTGNNGAFTGTTSVAGRFNNARNFDGGLTDKIELGSVTAGVNITVSAWIKTSSAATKGVFSNRVAGGELFFGVDTGKFFVFYNSGTPGSVYSAALVNNNAWRHIVWTSDGASSKMYIDGVLDNTTAQTRVATTGTGRIGWDTSGNAFLGQIDEVRTYNRVLTAAEVTDLAANYGYTTTNNASKELVRKFSSPEPTASPTGEIGPLYPADSPTIVPNTGQGYSNVSAFTQTLGTGSGGSVKYQISPNNGTTWYWWNGTIWTTTVAGATEASTAATINTNIGTFTAGTAPKTFKWRAYLVGDGSQQPRLDTLAITYVWDTVAPPNPASVTALNQSGGSTTLSSGNWYNYASPYFSWTAPTDTAGAGEVVSGVAGYYVYFGTDNTADPLTAGTFQAATNYTAGSMTSGSSYYLRIRTRDNDGNITAATAALFTYKFDAVSPANLDYVNVSPAGCSTASSFSFAWPASSDTHSGVAGYEYRLGSTGLIQFINALTVNAPPYQTGDNVFYARAKDQAGNVSAFQTVVYCSTLAATVVDGPTVVAGPSSLVVSWTSSKPTTSFVRVTGGNDYASEQGQSALTLNHSVKVVGLEPEKAYTYKLVWSDASGNPGESPLFTTNTGAAPAIKNLNVQVLGISSALVSWETTELSSAAVTYGIGNYANEQTLAGVATRFSQQLSRLEAGAGYQLRVEARTQDGYPYYSVITFQTPPLPTISNLRFDYLPSASATVRASWTTNVPSTSLVRYRAGDGAYQSVSSAELTTEHLLTIPDLLDNAVYELIAQSTDQYGNTGVSGTQRYETPFDTRAPKIGNLTVEVRSSGIGSAQKAQIVVSWETDEPATSQIEYGPGIGSSFYPSKSQEEASLTTNHVIIVSDLDPARIYHLRAVSKDRAGNSGASVDTTAITGKVQNSVIDLIINSLQRSLGFLSKLPFLKS